MTDDPVLEHLLRTGLRGPSAAAVRAAVTGAAAALRSAPDTGDGDSAHAAAEILSALAAEGEAQHVGSPAAEAAEAAAVTIPPGPRSTPPVPAGLAELAERFTSDPSVARWVGAEAVVAPTAGETWARLWFACLRLPDEIAETWRGRARALRGPVDPHAQWDRLTGAGAVLVEPGFGSTGLREGPDAPIPEQIDAVLQASGGYGTLPELATQVLTLAERDPTLHHALESRRRTGFHPLSDPDNLRDLRRDLGYRLGDLAAAAPGSLAALMELRGVDELICSVTHVPPAHPDSWWGRLAQRSRGLVTQSAQALRAGGETVVLRVIPTGDFAAQRELVGPYNVACPAPGRPESEILACLRVWMRAGAEVYDGRVVQVRNSG